jgi:hypothetical protein
MHKWYDAGTGCYFCLFIRNGCQFVFCFLLHDLSMDYDIFREELVIKYPIYGHALWEPSPLAGERYTAVQVGDVGFIRGGRFHRLFNVLLPADHESHGGGVPQNHEPLTLRMSPAPTTDSGTLPPNHLRSKGVSDSSDVDGRHALG